ncbi:MAG: tRNA (adenosine(37)-N6)-threonylcarbamoyltransferase complex dimerization subunit type 1 TsaB [Oscillospiraceae bacterium]|nr:tRNA (adenosine(37)-N6)-threonylcarbamoyltransferase complex dimerization subunit type 1 TsaB [Oscillospiraceae bacterium]
MLTLAFESSAKAASVALCDGENLIAQTTQNCGLTHSVTLLPMAEALLKNTGYKLSDVELFAVAHGPGSFTGIRIGVSAVKGLAWGAEKAAVGVSTLEAMAYNGLAFGECAVLCCVMDARRGQVYNALFEVRGGKPCRISDDRPIALAELAQEVIALNRPVYLIGDGWAVTEKYFCEAGIPYTVAPDPIRLQNAYGVAMAASTKQPGTADDVLPVYLRLSQAERERLERMNKE